MALSDSLPQINLGVQVETKAVLKNRPRQSFDDVTKGGKAFLRAFALSLECQSFVFLESFGSEWDKHLPSILLALRTVSHESTVRVGVWEKFANPRDVSNGTLDGTGRRK
ncbi:hypothetical protein TNCV_4355871 [Trichonephila clavipes]|nr:hypothetical protein TNCV_4355871 [Trichonephila clavipes]